MSQRVSGYARLVEYSTPEWVTEALIPHLRLRRGDTVYEPAAGTGKMVDALRSAGFSVDAGDIASGHNFLQCRRSDHSAIITNPPYEQAQEFIERALDLTEHDGLVAMLLRTDYDHAATRRHLFAGHPAFCKKVVLTKRIRWIENSTGSPSFNHCWMLWDWLNDGRAPTIAYEPRPRTDYDAQADLAGSINEGFSAIRERMAAGGPSWKPQGGGS